MKQIKLGKCFVAKRNGFFRMHLAQHSASNFSMVCGIAGKLTGFGRKRSALGQS